MLGIRSTTAARAVVRRLRLSPNHPGGSSSNLRTLVSHHSYINNSIQPSLASDANNAYFITRKKYRDFRFSSIKLYSTCSVSKSSTPRDDAALNCSSSVENGEADAEAAVPEAYVTMRNAAMDEAYYAIELALDSVVKIFTVASSPSYFLPWQNKSQRESMGSGLYLCCFFSFFFLWLACGMKFIDRNLTFHDRFFLCFAS